MSATPATHAGVAYRPEVDGLRALAVLPVIFYHAGFQAFRGGFVGVDVFFVISGYLITSIVASDCHAGKFSIGRFYERRARRILPALFVVIAACLPFAYAWMLPAQTQAFGRSMLATLDFVPNFYFWSTTQYFANTAEEIPLLHMWSLGVEEQFYLLFPLLIWLLWRFGLRTQFWATIVLALVSFGLSEWAWRHGKLSSNFFFPVTRAWELMLGALLALAWRVRPVHDHVPLPWCSVLSTIGLILLLGATFAFDSFTPMPGIYALVPALGAVLVIGYARPGTWVHRTLAHPWLVGIGLISYSAYLWHQPLFAFTRVRMGEEPSALAHCALIVLTFVLAYLTWRFVEAPFRDSRQVSRRVLMRGAVVGAGLFIGVGLVSEGTQGFSYRLPASDLALARFIDAAAQEDYENARFMALGRDFSDSATLKVAVVGDSYAEDLINAISESERLSQNVELRTFYVLPTCQIYFGDAGPVESFIRPEHRPNCRPMRDATSIRRRLERADIIVFASSWQRWAIERLPQTVALLSLRPTQRVIVVGPKRVGTINIRKMLQVPSEQRATIAQPVSDEIRETEAILRRSMPDSTFLSMQDAACGVGQYCRLFTPQGDLISFDGTHLTREGAKYVGRRLLESQPLAALGSVAH